MYCWHSEYIAFTELAPLLEEEEEECCRFSWSYSSLVTSFLALQSDVISASVGVQPCCSSLDVCVDTSQQWWRFWVSLLYFSALYSSSSFISSASCECHWVTELACQLLLLLFLSGADCLLAVRFVVLVSILIVWKKYRGNIKLVLDGRTATVSTAARACREVPIVTAHAVPAVIVCHLLACSRENGD